MSRGYADVAGGCAASFDSYRPELFDLGPTELLEATDLIWFDLDVARKWASRGGERNDEDRRRAESKE